MAKYRIEGTVVDTERASAHWEEARDFDGHNRIGRSSGSQWEYQTLYRSRKGRWYVVYESAWQGARPSAEWVSPQESARWLLHNDYQVPAELADAADQVSE